MVPQELSDQLEGFAEVGRSEESTRKLLLDLGWSEVQISEGISGLGGASKLFAKYKEVAETTGPKVVEIPSEKKRRQRLRLIFGLGVLILVLGFFGYWYLKGLSPQGFFSGVLGNLSEFRYDVKGRLERVAEDSALSLSLDFDLGGDFFRNGSRWPTTRLGLNFAVQGKGAPGFSGTFELLSLDETIYLKLDRGGGLISFFNEDPLQGKWVRVRAPEIFSVGDLVANQEVKDGISPTTVRRELSDSEREKLTSVFKVENFFEVEEELASELLGGEETRHFSLSIKEEKLKSFVVGWFDFFEQILTPSNVTTSLVSSLKASDLEVRGKGEAWVSKDNKLPLRLKVELDFNYLDRKWVLYWDGLYSPIGEARLEAPVPDESLENLVKGLRRILDKTRVYSLGLIQDVLALYQKKCGFYPGPANCGQGFKEPPVDLGSLVETLEKSGFDVSLIKGTLGEEERYSYGSNGSIYILGVVLDDRTKAGYSGAIFGSAFGVECRGPVFCVSPLSRIRP